MNATVDRLERLTTTWSICAPSRTLALVSLYLKSRVTLKAERFAGSLLLTATADRLTADLIHDYVDEALRDAREATENEDTPNNPQPPYLTRYQTFSTVTVPCPSLTERIDCLAREIETLADVSIQVYTVDMPKWPVNMEDQVVIYTADHDLARRLYNILMGVYQ